MWIYLSKLHPLLPYSLITIIVIAIVVIALKGKLMIKWGKTAIGIGGSPDNPLPVASAPITSIIEKKRACSDCLSIITNEYDKYNFNKLLREEKILTQRMNYTEGKLIEIEKDITALFEKRIDINVDEHETYLVIESKMFYGILKEALYVVKKEIRRSCKEEGFCELSDIEFAHYTHEKAKVLQSILLRELKRIYPTGTLVPIDFILSDIESKYDTFHEYINGIFIYAKQVIIEEEKEQIELEAKYQAWASNFVK
jgi:hypothetical protein